MAEDKKTAVILNPGEKKQDKKSIIRVAAYCRSSTDKDSMIKSLENQIQHYLKVIQDNKDFRLVGIYYDRASSGLRKEKRPGFQRLLRHCSENKIDLILTKSVSRFSRNSMDLLETVDYLTSKEITLHFERENINTLGMENKFFLSTLAAIAQEESQTISHLAEWGFERRFQKGIPFLKPQFGYFVQTDNQYPIITINEKEAAVVREIFELFLSGVKKPEIARRMMEKGVKTARGNEFWTDNTVKKILKNHNYTGDKLTNTVVRDFLNGKYKQNDGSKQQYLIENSHPAIISRETFYKAQELLEQSKAKHKSSPSKPKKDTDVMSKRIICGLCDIVYYSYPKLKQPAWICRRKNFYSKLCDSKTVKASDILVMAQKAFKKRYDFNNPGVLKEMFMDIKRMNIQDHFEYQRIINFLELERAGDKNGREAGEEKIKKFEEWATKVEEDRTCRDQAISWLERDVSIEQFLEELTLRYMRAWILSITIFSSQDFIIRWLDNTETKIGQCNLADKKISPQKRLPERARKKGEEKLKPEKENQVSVVEPDLSMMVSQNVKKEYERFVTNLDSPARVDQGKPKIRTAAYARISTELPHQLGSLETQIAYYTYYILKNPKQSLVKVYAEKAVSGTNVDHRKEFLRLIEDCKLGKIDRIITKSISRFARNTVDCLEYVRMLKALDPPVEVIFQKENIRTLDEDSEVMLTVYSGLAQEESRSLAESIAWGKRRLAERGVVNSKDRRYGYDYDEDGNWVINEKEAEVIRRMYRELISGMSTRKIAKGLSEDGIKTASGNKIWHSRSVDCMITNPVYCGDYVSQRFYASDTFKKKNVENKGELPKYVVEDHHPAIVSREEWEAAQEIMENRGGNKGKKLKPHTRQEFFNVFYCSECGSPLIHIRCSANGYHYWRCSASEKKNTSIVCQVRGFREESIEHAFMAMLQEMKAKERFETEVKKAVEEFSPGEREYEKIEEVKEEMQKLYYQLYDTVEEGEKHGGDPNKIKQITDQIVALQEQVYDFEEREQQSIQLQKDLDWFLKELESIQGFNPEKERIEFRPDIFSRIVEKGTAFPDGRIVYDLKFGTQYTSEGNEIMAWRLKKKKGEK